VALPAAAIGALSLLLAAGLELTGMLAIADKAVADQVARHVAGGFPLRIPDWGVWLCTAVLSFGTAAALLGTPGRLRRVMLWLSGVILVGAWAPVLGLAAHAPEIAAPWIATIWSGICSLVYASRHRMPVDRLSPGKAAP
jgi:hypothetical protein